MSQLYVLHGVFFFPNTLPVIAIVKALEESLCLVLFSFEKATWIPFLLMHFRFFCYGVFYN